MCLVDVCALVEEFDLKHDGLGFLLSCSIAIGKIRVRVYEVIVKAPKTWRKSWLRGRDLDSSALPENTLL